MQVTFQDCDCIALPDEIVDALVLSAGSILDITPDSDLKAASLVLAQSKGSGVAPSLRGYCRIGTVGN